MNDQQKYLEKRAGAKCFYGGLKALAGSWILPFCPPLGISLIVNGTMQAVDGVKMGDAAKGKS